MTPERSQFLRNNAFLMAAVALPLIVAGFFIVASAIPRWTVPPPAHDLVMRVARPFDATLTRLSVDFGVRDGLVEATVQRTPPNGYSQPWALFLFDHKTMTVREIPLRLPTTLAEGEESRTIVIDSLSGYRVSSQVTAPDGYELLSRGYRGPGLVGELFGMHRYDQSAMVGNRGRVVPIHFPSEYQYQAPVYLVGWIVEEGRR